MSFPTHAQHKIHFLADPEIVAIQIQENNEPLIDLNDQDIISFGPSPEVPNNTDYTKMRKSVYEMLLQAQDLLPNGLKFCLYEGHRSLALQKRLFADRYSLLKTQHSDWTHAQIFHETTRLVSPVENLDGSRNVPPHSTGGALDLYLINAHGEVIEMGLKLEDWMQDIDGAISITDSTKITAEAKHNRTIMSDVLTEVGFVNYGNEYWHWSYGDRYWAFYKQQPFALYGSL